MSGVTGKLLKLQIKRGKNQNDQIPSARKRQGNSEQFSEAVFCCINILVSMHCPITVIKTVPIAVEQRAVRLQML